MKKTILAALALALVAAAAQAEQTLSATTGIASNYIYRGINYYSQGATYASQGRPIFTGSLDYANGPLSANLFATPEDSFNFDTLTLEADTDLISSLSLNRPSDVVSVGAGVNYYAFVKNASNNMTEFTANATYKQLRLDSSYINNFVGLQTNYFYNQLAFRPVLSENSNILLHVGYVVFGEGVKIDSSNYLDYKAGFEFALDGFSYQVAYSNTAGRKSLATDTVSTQDAAIIVSLSKTFSIIK